VALARCLVMKPAILLLDEPMAALDRGLRAQVQRELISIQRAVGTTFIVVTHDQEEALQCRTTSRSWTGAKSCNLASRSTIRATAQPVRRERPRQHQPLRRLGRGARAVSGAIQDERRPEFVINHEVDLQLATIDAAGFGRSVSSFLRIRPAWRMNCPEPSSR